MDDKIESDQSVDLVAVARIVRTRGLRGEVIAELLTDFPDRFDGLEQLTAAWPDGKREVLDLEEHWLQANRIVLKFAGYDSIEGSRVLIGTELGVPFDERVELSEDEFFDFELTGCRVENTAGEYVGQVREVMHTGATDLLVVDGVNPKGDHLIPLADEICVEIDIAGKLIRINPPDGLLEL